MCVYSKDNFSKVHITVGKFNGQFKILIRKIIMHTLNAHQNPNSLIKIELYTDRYTRGSFVINRMYAGKFLLQSQCCNEQNIDSIIMKMFTLFSGEELRFPFVIELAHSIDHNPMERAKYLSNLFPLN